jgi:DNA-binding response OmpR family regulator
MMSTRVLIVDDEPNIVISLEFLMQQQGYETATAADGRVALSEAGRFRPDLVLLDITLPELDGFQVCEQLRAAHGSDMGIIMLTARGQEAEVAKGLALGADAYVTKPFSTRDLVGTVHKLIGTPRCSGG